LFKLAENHLKYSLFFPKLGRIFKGTQQANLGYTSQPQFKITARFGECFYNLKVDGSTCDLV